MQASLALLMDLPDATRVCCAHEYTLSNLHFAATVEPDNPHIADQIHICTTLRAQGLPTLPTTIGRERLINPFVRAEHLSVATAARLHDPQSVAQVGVFATLRQWKNHF